MPNLIFIEKLQQHFYYFLGGDSCYLRSQNCRANSCSSKTLLMQLMLLHTISLSNTKQFCWCWYCIKYKYKLRSGFKGIILKNYFVAYFYCCTYLINYSAVIINWYPWCTIEMSSKSALGPWDLIKDTLVEHYGAYQHNVSLTHVISGVILL
jgi:hypothetical protein